MKKGIAVPYIIAIVLGIAVLALLGYWFYITSGTFSRETCRQAYRDWCQGLSNRGYPPADTTLLKWQAYKPECKAYPEFLGIESDCRFVLGQPAT